MQEDNVYRRGTAPQAVPKDQADAAREEKLQVLDSLPIIKETIASLDESIELLASIDTIPADVLKTPNEFMHTVAANKIAKAVLEVERQKLVTLVTEHTT